ncbi:oligosaccharide flippase family protein [Vibrio chagasii]|uniref:oligosaccharide flippase family protein n=1 Tax=Vibrio chagasii TaxID=170679 RepID=UPI0038CD66A4
MLINKVLWSAVEIISTRVIQLAITVVLARLLTPEDFGLIALVMVFISLSQVMVDGGLSAAIIRKNELSETQISTAFYMNAMLALFIYTIVYLLSPIFAEIAGDDRLNNVLRVVGLVLIINVANFVPRALFTRDMDYKNLGKSSILGAILSGSVAIFLANDGFGYWSLVVQTLVMNLVCALVLNLCSNQNRYRNFDLTEAKELFGYGYKILISGLVEVLFKNIYIVLISKNYTSREVGLFSQSERLASISIISFTQNLTEGQFSSYGESQ